MIDDMSRSGAVALFEASAAGRTKGKNVIAVRAETANSRE
jgi:hypothetical protein